MSYKKVTKKDNFFWDIFPNNILQIPKTTSIFVTAINLMTVKLTEIIL